MAYKVFHSHVKVFSQLHFSTIISSPKRSSPVNLLTITIELRLFGIQTTVSPASFLYRFKPSLKVKSLPNKSAESLSDSFHGKNPS